MSARKAYALCFKYFYFETYEKKKQKTWVGGIKDNIIINIVFAFYHDACVGSAHNFSVRGNIVVKLW